MSSLQVREQFSIESAAALMRHPAIFDGTGDDMTPSAEQVPFEQNMLRAHVLTYLVEWEGAAVGYVQFSLKNSTMAELHVGFLPQFRGRCAVTCGRWALAKVFGEKGVLKVMAMLPSDARPALLYANMLGLRREGRLTRAVLRNGSLIDLIILGVSRDVGPL